MSSKHCLKNIIEAQARVVAAVKTARFFLSPQVVKDAEEVYEYLTGKEQVDEKEEQVDEKQAEQAEQAVAEQAELQAEVAAGIAAYNEAVENDEEVVWEAVRDPDPAYDEQLIPDAEAEPPEDCPICSDPMTGDVTTTTCCQQTFCTPCIEKWKESSDTCMNCRAASGDRRFALPMAESIAQTEGISVEEAEEEAEELTHLYQFLSGMFLSEPAPVEREPEGKRANESKHSDSEDSDFVPDYQEGPDPSESEDSDTDTVYESADEGGSETTDVAEPADLLLADGDKGSDRIETSPDIIKEVMPLLEAHRRKLGKERLRVLDPCYCAGQQIKNFAEYPNVELIHTPEMSLGGALEVCDANLPAFEEMGFDVILTNPPWSAENLCNVLSTLVKLSDAKTVPLLYLIPDWSTKSEQYFNTMRGVKLVGWKTRRMKFLDPSTGTTRSVLGSDQLNWFGYNWTGPLQGGDRITVRRLGDDFDEKEDVEPAVAETTSEEEEPTIEEKAEQLIADAAAVCLDLPAVDQLGADIANYASICDPDAGELKSNDLVTALQTNHNFAVGKTNLYLVGAYNTSCYFEQFKSANKHKTDTAAIKALKAKGVSITSTNCTRFRQFRKAIDEVKAYKFLYGCAAPWRDVRDLLPKNVFLNAFKQFQTDFPEDFANFQ